MQSGLLGSNLLFCVVRVARTKLIVLCSKQLSQKGRSNGGTQVVPYLEGSFRNHLSIADPITDILTLREFYRAGHKTWFGVGVTSIIFPTVFFLYGNFNIETDRGQWTAWKCTHVLVLGCNPLLPAWLKLRTLIC